MKHKIMLPKGTILQLGNWDTGWISKVEIIGHTPKCRFYKVKNFDGKIINQSVKEVTQGYFITFDGSSCPIKIIK
jgi:hypothetical protein